MDNVNESSAPPNLARFTARRMKVRTWYASTRSPLPPGHRYHSTTVAAKTTQHGPCSSMVNPAARTFFRQSVLMTKQFCCHHSNDPRPIASQPTPVFHLTIDSAPRDRSKTSCLSCVVFSATPPALSRHAVRPAVVATHIPISPPSSRGARALFANSRGDQPRVFRRFP